MKHFSAALLCLLLLMPVPGAATALRNALPADAAEALRSASEAEIYSLEPYDSAVDEEADSSRLHGYLVLGKAALDPVSSRAAVAEFETAVANWNGLVAACFDPRHGLRTKSNGHTFDFLLCYDCNGLAVYRDGTHVTSIGVTGSPRVLDEMMEALGLVLSETGYEPPSPEEIAEREAAMARWLGGMPASALPHWEASERFHSGLGLSADEMAALRTAIEQETPEPRTRIRSLLRWYGSGAGPWSGYPGWEDVPAKLLLEFETRELLSAIDLSVFDTAQREGTARLFAGWDFHEKQANDLVFLPEALKLALLEHVIGTGESTDDDRRRRARYTFGEP
jgi:hypothetical protein